MTAETETEKPTPVRTKPEAKMIIGLLMMIVAGLYVPGLATAGAVGGLLGGLFGLFGFMIFAAGGITILRRR
jgi:hypothetical protein